MIQFRIVGNLHSGVFVLKKIQVISDFIENFALAKLVTIGVAKKITAHIFCNFSDQLDQGVEGLKIRRCALLSIHRRRPHSPPMNTACTARQLLMKSSQSAKKVIIAENS